MSTGVLQPSGEMEINLLGRVENLTLPVNAPLVPLYEAVINAIQAIEEANIKGAAGKINIRIIRESDGQQTFDVGEREVAPISGFEISDNGIGFNENNLRSFRTSDSRYKLSRGGKGIGRLFWLKAFEKVEISSITKMSPESDSVARKISFSLKNLSVLDGASTGSTASGSIVKLIGFKEEYRANCKKRAISIADRIIEHCLIHFFDSNCPTIILEDEHSNQETIILNERFREAFSSTTRKIAFEIGPTCKFELTIVSLYSVEETSSQLLWTANRREVFSENLSKLVPNLKNKLRDENDRPYLVWSYLSGSLLDEKVSSDRARFDIRTEDEEPVLNLGADSVTMKNIRDVISEKIKEHLNPVLEPIETQKRKDIGAFVNDEAPEYRALIAIHPEVLESVPPGLSKEKLDLELHKAQYKMESRIKEDGQKFTRELSSMDSSNRKEVEDKQDKYLKELSELSKANLAKYVLGRKAILELFASAIKQSPDGSFEREDFVHSLIFPRYRTSDEINFDDHNLWLLDESLAYHAFLGSEKAIGKVPGSTSNSTERPDLIVFDNPTVFAEGEAGAYSAVTVVEFKRPGREKVSTNGRDPIQQLYDYITEIRKGHRRDSQGLELRVSESTPFFAYLVCDLTQELERSALGASLMKDADGQGYFGFNPGYRVYVEVVSYRKAYEDARKRNRAFFRQLGL